MSVGPVAAIGGGAGGLFLAPFSQPPLPPSISQDVLDLPGASTSALRQCAAHTALMRKKEARTRYGIFDESDGERYDGVSRRGALFCRTGTWLEILDQPTAEREQRIHSLSRPEFVRGTRSENSRFSVLEFISVMFGLVSIRGVESQLYLCMDREGRLYGADRSNYSLNSSECVFMEEMLENYYNLYASCAHGSPKRPWYIALRKTGRPRRGSTTRRRRKPAHFLVVHYDSTTTTTRAPPSSKRYFAPGRPMETRTLRSETPPVDLDTAIDSALKHRPPRNRHFRSPIEMARKITERKTTVRNIQAVVPKNAQKRREARLQREEAKRRHRKEELEKRHQEEEQQHIERMRNRTAYRQFEEHRRRVLENERRRQEMYQVDRGQTPRSQFIGYRGFEATTAIPTDDSSSTASHRHHSAYGGFSRPVENRDAQRDLERRRQEEYQRFMEARRRQKR